MKIAFGTELWMAPSGDTLVKVAKLLTVEPPKMKRETMDATTHDSPAGAMEFVAAGVFDPGDVSGQVNFIAGDTVDDALRAAITSGELYDFKIVVKSASDTEDMTFSGYVTEYGVDALPTDGKQTASFSIKVSGPVDQAASA